MRPVPIGPEPVRIRPASGGVAGGGSLDLCLAVVVGQRAATTAVAAAAVGQEEEGRVRPQQPFLVCVGGCGVETVAVVHSV